MTRAGVLVLALLLVSACGGGPEREKVTLAAWAVLACDAIDLMDAPPPDWTSFVSLREVRDEAQALALMEQVTTAAARLYRVRAEDMRDAADALEAVEPPEEARSYHRRLSDAIDDASDQVEDLTNGLARGDESSFLLVVGPFLLEPSLFPGARDDAGTPPPEVARALRRARC